MKFFFAICLAFAAFTVALSASCDNGAQIACTREYEPVCATFTKTFSNYCELESMKCELAKQGFQSSEVQDGDCCARGVILSYWPVCGTDGVTYSNYATMEVAACKNRDHIIPQDPDNCPDFPEEYKDPIDSK